uniref:SEFIR domain-containing protein n=1 Tax=Amphilophus citrinellus TaxID=61819 RepID=A0A3Q0R905_AMPCI
MARTLQWMPRVVSILLSLRLELFVSAGGLKSFDQDTPELTCSKFCPSLPDPYGTVAVTQVQLNVALCCSDGQNCSLCLQVIISLQGVDNEIDVSEESGDDSDEGMNQTAEQRALVKVHLSTPPSTEKCIALRFKQSSEQSTHEVTLSHVRIVSILDELSLICGGWRVNSDEFPRLQAVMDHERNVILLKLEITDGGQRDEIFWKMVWEEIPGEVHAWPKDKNEVVISLDYVAPCLCFQAGRIGKTQGKFCPFQTQQDALERMRHNVSVIVVESQMRDGGTGLSWNVSAPCTLEAEVWLCKKDLMGGQCEEVTGSRQRLQESWTAGRNLYWQTGEFNLSPHPLLCVQIHINGTKSRLEPQCPFATSRLRWSLALIMGLLLMCLAILGAYLIQGVLQGYVWRWLKDEDVKGAVSGGHVVLLYPPNDNPHLPEILCHLGSSLQALGFSVSLDLWSQTELSILGPVPWLHSRLDQLQRQGGKVVLVLTQASWTRAEAWRASSRCVDAFSASLSCILADYLQGRAGERFMLVQFESFPPEPPGSLRPLPELFRGLHVYSLPSQSLGFLTELAGGHQMATASARRKRAGGIRMASRTLAQRLSAFTAGANVLRLAGVPQNGVAIGTDDLEETVPLQPSLITPPSSPDTDPQVTEMDWA